MSKTAIVLSRNYSTALSVIRGLGLAGYEVDLIITVRTKDADQAQIAACSKYVRKAHILNGRKYSQATDQRIVDCLKSYIGTTDHKILLFPTDDYSVMLMDRHRESLRYTFLMPFISQGQPLAMTRLMDKRVQSQLAREAGMKTPREWVLDLSSFTIPEDMAYPCFVKPLQSTAGYKTEMKRCDSPKELAGHLAGLTERNPDRSILIQEFLFIDEEISMSGVCRDQEIILPALVAKSRIARHETGVTLAGRLVPVDSVGKETKDQILATLRAFHYVGQFDMEILRCKDSYYFGEVNLRSGGPNFAYTLNGVNLTAIAAQAICQELAGIPEFSLTPEAADTCPAVNPAGTCPAVDPADTCPADDPADTCPADGPADTCPADDPADTCPAADPADTCPAADPVDTCGIRFHRPFVYEKVAWEDYLNFRMSRRQLEECLGEAEDKLLDWSEDPAPGVKFNQIMRKLSLVERGRALGKKTPVYRMYKAAGSLRPGGSDIKKPLKAHNKMSASDVLAGKALKPAGSKRVILISRNYSSLLGMIRTFANTDYEIEVIRTYLEMPKATRVYMRMIPEGFSRYVSHYHVCVMDQDPGKLIDLLESLHRPDQPTLLMPLDDLPMSIVDACYDRLKGSFLLPDAGKTQGRCVELMDKNLQKKLLTDFGFHCVQSHDIEISCHRYQLPEGISYPCFLKPAVSAASSKNIMCKCDSENALRQILDLQAAQNESLSLIVEDYLEIEREYALLGLCIKDQVLIPNGMVEMLESGHGSRVGVTMFGQVTDTDTPRLQPLMDQIAAFMRTLDYTGLFDVDLLEANGRIYFCELNLRFGASGYAITASGLNMPLMFADYMTEGTPIDTRARLPQTGLCFVSEKVLLEEHGEHYITSQQLKETLNKADIYMIMDDKDPEPYNYLKKFYKYAWILPMWKKVKKVLPH